MNRKITNSFILITFLTLLITFLSTPVFAGYLEIPKFLCERGIEYYMKGDYDNALDSFKKALLANPQGKTAKVCEMYIELIKEKKIDEKRIELAVPKGIPEERVSAEELERLKRELAIKESMLEATEKEREKVEIPERVAEWPEVPKELPKEKEVVVPVLAELEKPEKVELEKVKVPTPTIVPVKKVPKVEILKEKVILDKSSAATQASTVLELEVNQAFVVEGKQISRWLSTNPGVIDVRRKDADTIEVVGKKISPTYLHIWDQNGRWTLNIKVISPRYIKQLIEKYRRELEQVKPFKFSYTFLRNSFHRGEEGRLSSLERRTLTFNQWLGIDGETPYGDFDTLAKISKLRETTDLTYFTMGLRDASLWGLSDFDIRGFDYTASFSDLAFPGESLRGVRFDKRAFDETLNYTAFWGREGQGKFGRLSPGLADPKDAFIYGTEFRFSPWDTLDYRLSSFWGYGDEREEELRDNVLGAGVNYRLKKNIALGGDFGWDYDNLAYTLDSHMVFPKLRLSGEFRDIDSNFETIIGRPTRSGEIGGLIEANYSPVEWLYLSGNFNLYRDRLFPNPDDPNRLNLDLNTSSYVTINPTTSGRIGYQYANEKGKLSPRESNNVTASVIKSFPDFKNLTTHLSYGYKDSKSPKTPSMDYYVNSLAGGLNLRLLGNLYYYASEEIDWLTEEFTDDKSRPMAFETGLDYSSQLFTLPLYTTLRLNYRDEENALSTRSFLSGEDSLGFSGEVSFRPRPDFELFASTRLRNFWAENPDTEERIEADLRIGGKIRWDTGLHWNPAGTIEGLVYRDLNDDGTKQDDEQGIENIKLYVGKKEVTTDQDGFYSVSLRGKKVTINVDSSSLPAGVVISDAGSKEVEIEEGKVITVDFRLISRSEIYGVVFEDVDGDGRFDASEVGIPKVKLTLEDERAVVTDAKGQYYFRKVVAGEHIVTVDINSIPIEYLPQVPLTKKITLFEGITYIHNVPLKRAK